MCLGDEIDAAYQDELQEIVDLTGTPETAYNIFSDVVKHPFDLDEHGGGEGDSIGDKNPLAVCDDYLWDDSPPSYPTVTPQEVSVQLLLARSGINPMTSYGDCVSNPEEVDHVSSTEYIPTHV